MRRHFVRKVSLGLCALGGLFSVVSPTTPSSATLYIDTDSDGFAEPVNSVNFRCELTRQGWTMIGQTKNGEEVSRIMTFSSQGNLSAEERCHRVTRNFNNVNALEGVYFLKTDTVYLVEETEDALLVTEHPVICAVLNHGNSCTGDGSIGLLTLDASFLRSADARDQVLGRIYDHIDYLHNPATFVSPFEQPPMIHN